MLWIRQILNIRDIGKERKPITKDSVIVAMIFNLTFTIIAIFLTI